MWREWLNRSPLGIFCCFSPCEIPLLQSLFTLHKLLYSTLPPQQSLDHHWCYMNHICSRSQKRRFSWSLFRHSFDLLATRVWRLWETRGRMSGCDPSVFSLTNWNSVLVVSCPFLQKNKTKINYVWFPLVTIMDLLKTITFFSGSSWRCLFKIWSTIRSHLCRIPSHCPLEELQLMW